MILIIKNIMDADLLTQPWNKERHHKATEDYPYPVPVTTDVL